MTEQHSPSLHPLRRDGTTQQQRQQEALLPENTLIDERSLFDMLRYLHKYAPLLRYYNLSNIPVGDWVDFIENNPTCSLALFSAIDLQANKRAFNKQVNAIRANEDKPPCNIEESYNNLFKINNPLCKLVEQLGFLYQHAIEGQKLHTILADVKDILEEIIELAPPKSGIAQFVNFAFAEAVKRPGRRIQQNPIVQENIQGDTQEEDQFSLVEKSTVPKWVGLWFQAPDQKKIVHLKEQSTSAEDLQQAVKRTAHKMNQLHKTALFITENIEEYLRDTLEKYSAHQPHLALLLTFLHLFKHAQDDLNTLTARHLNFYYREILHLHPKPEQADKVHLVFEAAKHLSRYKLDKNTLVTAGNDSDGKNLLYATDEELVVNKARVDEKQGLKTVFVKKENEQVDEIIKSVHAAHVANSEKGNGEKIENKEGTWATFGNKDMPKAKMGFAVASPMFLLAEGERCITIYFIVDATSEIPEQLVSITNKLIDRIKVYASGEKEWIPLHLKNIAADRTEKIIGFSLTLENDQSAITGYNDKTLQQGFQTTDPIVKFEFIDPENATEDSFFPYDFFKDIKLVNLEIEIKVNGVKNLILENDLGVLNPAKPFMPFGPIPKKGVDF